MIKVVIFDLDDTLISEYEYIKSGYRFVSQILNERYRITGNINEELNQLFIESPKNVFNRLLDNHHISYDKEDILCLVNEYRNHVPDIYLYDDVIPLLEKLSQKNIRFGIITDGYLSTQKNKVEVLKLNEYFEKIIYTESLGRKYWKPNPKSFELMKEYFNVEYDEIMYIGDNPQKDFYINHYYPIYTVQINRNQKIYKNNNYFQEVYPKLIINNLLELEKFIN